MSKNKKLGGLERFRLWIDERNLQYAPVMLDDAANTAEQAATALGCSVSQIAKSLIFCAQESNSAILVIASGTNRVNEHLVAEILGEPIGRADAAFVRQQTGYAIGGVPPFAHVFNIQTLIDKDLLQFETIWAAAGHPKSVFELKPGDLIELTDGKTAAVC